MDNKSRFLMALEDMVGTLPMHMPGHKRNPFWGSGFPGTAAYTSGGTGGVSGLANGSSVNPSGTASSRTSSLETGPFRTGSSGTGSSRTGFSDTGPSGIGSSGAAFSRTSFSDTGSPGTGSSGTGFSQPGSSTEESAVASLGRRRIYELDFTEVPGLDDLHAPEGIIAEAQRLAADCFKAKHSFFLINGASVGIAAAVMACCREGDKVLVPRNAHRCVYEGLVLSGAFPVYFQPEYSPHLPVPLSPDKQQVIDLIHQEKPKAIVLVHPTYHGAGCDLSLIGAARENKLVTIVDESHGSHFSFDNRLPMSAVEAGADVVVHSTHKTLGSLTQTGIMHLAGNGLDPESMAGALSLLQSTSPSYILMASLEAMRTDLARRGREIVGRSVDLALELRGAVSRIDGFFCGDLAGPFGYDPTKILLQSSFMKGFELGETLRRDYGIYAELEEEAFILLMITVGDTKEGIERLVAALRDISSREFGGCRECEVRKGEDGLGGREASPGGLAPGRTEFFDRFGRAVKEVTVPGHFAFTGVPEVVLSPRQAFQSPKKKWDLRKAAGKISGSLVVPYPPGVPVLCPGERISREIVEYLNLIRQNGAHIQGLFTKNGEAQLLILEAY